MPRQDGAAGLVELNPHFSCWKGSLIPSAFAALVEGIRNEQARLQGKRLVFVAFRQEYDIDGVTESVEGIEGFDDLATAKRCAEICADDFYAGTERPSVEAEMLARLAQLRRPVSTVARIYYSGLKVAGGSGFNSVYCHLEVLQVSIEPLLGEPLFTYLNCQHELIHYFMRKGGRRS
jgi:hypothetical protein